MSSQGINIAEEMKIVPLIYPVDITGGATAKRFNMKNHGHASILIMIGVSAAAEGLITVNAYAAASGGSGTALPFNVYKQETTDVDTFGSKVAATSTGVQPPATDKISYMIEIDATDLPDGKPWVELGLADTSNSVIASAAAILSGARYASDPANAQSVLS